MVHVETANVTTAPATNAWSPWDMPYFGAPIYLRYQPKRISAADSESVATTFAVSEAVQMPEPIAGQEKVQRQINRFDPWDAPYFGGTLYLGYYPSLRAEQAKDYSITTSRADLEESVEKVPVVAPSAISDLTLPASAGLKRSNWFSRLFERR